ncbi:MULTISPECIES: histidine kinase [unclassified Streptomyces]|uniref:histidine kinase n=1 Tax=unclassified Streptomyces TaxID=2593676 RepID=UPI00201EA958|nr:histidine kinase [Streptomyces sp. 35G-GA-8]MCL7376202.1 histidine kinase [Streptomyces sp. 35G-GA-8]
MPSYDITRPRFRLTDEHVIVLTELATGRPVPDEYAAAGDELRQCGLLGRDGELSVLLLPMMKTLVNPVVVISLEATGRQGTLNHGLIIGEDHVVAHQSWPGEREAEYTTVEPKTLVWAMANLVNLQQSAAVRDAGLAVVETTVATLEAGVGSMADVPATASGGAERERVRAALESTGTLSEPALALFADMIGELRSSWRMTAAWRGRDGGQDGVAVRGFGVWDCGPLGYWHRELPAEPVAPGQVGPASAVRLTRTDAKRIWEMITDLLPAEGEIRRAAGR